MLIINIFMNLLLNQFYKHILKRDFIELYEKQVYFEMVYCFYQSIYGRCTWIDATKTEEITKVLFLYVQKS